MATPLRNKNILNDPNLNGTVTQTIINVGGATPILGASFVTLGTDPNLTNERILATGSALTLTDNGPNSSIVVDMADTAVTPGTYTYPTFTVDQKGRLTAASSGSAPATQTTLFNETGTNANTIFIGSKLLADAARRFSATVSGDLAWGDGTATKVRLNYASGSQLQIVDGSNNAADLSLSTLRGNAAIFTVPNTTNVSFETRTTGDANPRFQVVGSGIIGLGGGTAGMDTYLWRSATGELSLGSGPTVANATLRVGQIKSATGNLTLNPATSVDFSGKNATNLGTLTAATSITTPSILTATGDLSLNPAGTGINCTNHSLYGVTSLQTPAISTASGNLSLNPAGTAVDFNNKQIINAILPSSGLTFPISYTTATSTNQFVKTNVSGDSYERWAVDASGMHTFGPGGASINVDTWLYRSNIGELVLSGQPKSNGVKNGTLAVNYIRGTDGLNLSSNTSDINVSSNNLRNVKTAEIETISSPAGKLYLELNPDTAILYGKPFWAGGTSFGPLDPVFIAIPSGGTNNTLIIRPTEIGLGVGTTAIGAFIRATATNTISITDTSGATTPGTTNFRVGSINCNSISSLSNNLAINPQGAGPTYTNTNSGCLLLGASGTFNNCTRVTMIGSNRNATNRTGNVILTDGASPTAGTPGGDNTFEGRFQGWWLSSNTSNSTGVQMGSGLSAWSAISDAKTKAIHKTLEHKSALARGVEGSNILDSLSAFELYEYHYLDADDPNQKIVGPTTQSFYGSFGGFIDKEPKKRIYTGAFDEEGNCVSKCLNVGDEMELLDERDEKTAMWMVMKALNEELASIKRDSAEEIAASRGSTAEELAAFKKENAELREGLRKTMEVVKGLSNRLKATEAKLALVGTSVGTFDKL